MKRLDKFSLLIETPEMGKEVKRIADKNGLNEANYSFCLNKEYDGVPNAIYFLGSGSNYMVDNKDNYPLITFDQFKQMFESKIIKWKVKNLQTKFAISEINSLVSDWDGIFKVGCNVEEELKSLGVLELWCEPIYEEVNTELDNLKSEAEQLKNQLDKVMNAINELDKK
jgi:hypothetical protein